MNDYDPMAPRTLDSIGAYVKKNAARVKNSQEMHMSHSPLESVREADHNGHHIKITTTYKVEVDGRPQMSHFDVSNAGQVHYHGIPNVQFDSAIDLVKNLIELYPEDFAPGPVKSSGDSEHSGHMHTGHATEAAASRVKTKSKDKRRK